MVHEFPGWTDELRSLQVPALLIFGDRDFSPLPDVVEIFELLPDAQLAVLPGTTHVGVTRRPGEVLRIDGHANIAAANRHHARDPQRTIKLLQTA
jgi:pimeloyl-ACP methyl ester carboxylesterase